MHRVLHNVGFRVFLNILFLLYRIKSIVTIHKRNVPCIRSAILFIFFIPSLGSASFEDMEVGARSSGLAGAVAALSQGSESLAYNPAALTPSTPVDVLLSYNKPFSIPDLHNGCAAASFAFRKLRVGGLIHSFGNEAYQETQFAVSSAINLLDGVSGGIALRYADLSITGYGHAGAFLIDVGSVARLSPFVQWGFVLKNVNYAHIGSSREPLPQIYATGVSLRPSEPVLLNVDVYKDCRFPLDVRCGVEYSPLPVLSLRTGVGNEPTRFCFGFSLHLKFITFDYSVCHHTDLGLTHMMAVNIPGWR